ncbi:AraC family transcriptional regulator [Pseudomonas sp. v388]|uniref:AraC family transcriptional regulator n=1 Tax=Pseudomonas sp. v388 TaxID=2479849 RepID=UPI000F7693EB|nr:AraC family transcriptional regulator [Pseudomonas sp. v388]RRV05286.1 AraC family transcriptional regulator [Pseudomonas sp. v388]
MDRINRHPTPVTPFFWRDERLPFIEARSVEDGRKLCYARHSHEVFSIGAITAGTSTYLHEKTSQTVSQGTVVLMNPGAVHACNPIADQPWSYLMLYVNSQWLGERQAELLQQPGCGFQPLAATASTDPALYSGLVDLYRTLIDPDQDTLHKQCTALSFFTLLQQVLGSAPHALDKPLHRVAQAARFIDEHFSEPIRLDDICAAASLSASYLIRAFEQRYHMTPHAYLINRRIQHARNQLKQGRLIADVAHETGFADQAHLQREFKKHLAATPGQYRL